MIFQCCDERRKAAVLGNPVLNIGQANTGVVTGTQVGGRQMQIALKVVF